MLPSIRRFLPLEKVYLRDYSAILNMKVILQNNHKRFHGCLQFLQI